MKIIMLLLLAWGWSASVWGQDNAAEVRKKINSIKKSQSYLSAEATLDTEEEARKTANELLVTEINEWVKEKRNSEEVKQVVLQDISSCSEHLNMKRGAKVRVFVYVKKRDIVLIKGAGQIVLNENEKGSDLQSMESVAGVMNAGKEDEEAAGEPLPDSQAALEQVKSAGTMSRMQAVFADLKEKGLITYAKYPAEELPESYYLLFYTRAGEVKAVVSAEKGSFVELKTGKKVMPADYSGCGAYWFMLK